MQSTTMIFITGKFSIASMVNKISKLLDVNFVLTGSHEDDNYISEYFNFHIDIYDDHGYVDDEICFSRYKYVIQIEPLDNCETFENYKKRHIVCRSIINHIRKDVACVAIVVDDLYKLVTPYDDLEESENLKLAFSENEIDGVE